MELPPPRGMISEHLVAALRRPPHDLPAALATAVTSAAGAPGPVTADEDLQLVLFICYELHYRGWSGVDDRWEWHPSLLALLAAAESRFEAGLRTLVNPAAPPDRPDASTADGPSSRGESVTPRAVARALAGLVAADADAGGPSLSRYLQGRATMEQFREFVAHRSVYHLKEADPHTWGIPRLAGTAKAALVEIQIDEYGGGQPARMHSELFRTTMECLGLDSEYGAHVAVVPAVTLATNNVISLFGLHRRHRGALIGHLAAFEMTSSLPNRHYGNGLRRLGGSSRATRFYDEHVEADAVHEQIAAYDLCGRFCQAEPDQTEAVLFGAACALAVDRCFAGQVLGRWRAGASSLLPTRAGRPRRRTGSAARPG